MKQGSVLVVDDDESILNIFQAALEEEGFFVETVKTGEEALEKLKQKKFDLIILDIVLPGMRGDEVALKIREVDDLTKIVFITGYPSFQECINALDIGIHEILLKPISPSEILHVTEEALSRERCKPSKMMNLPQKV